MIKIWYDIKENFTFYLNIFKIYSFEGINSTVYFLKSGYLTSGISLHTILIWFNAIFFVVVIFAYTNTAIILLYKNYVFAFACEFEYKMIF